MFWDFFFVFFFLTCASIFRDVAHEIDRVSSSNFFFLRHGSNLNTDRKDVVVALFSWKGTSISFIIFHNYHQDPNHAEVRLAGQDYRE